MARSGFEHVTFGFPDLPEWEADTLTHSATPTGALVTVCAHGDFILLSHWEGDQATGTMICSHPTQSHYSDTEPSSPSYPNNAERLTRMRQV